MKHIDLLLGHNVGYKGSMSRLAIKVLQCFKERPPGDRGMPKGIKIWLFQGVKVDKIT